jgi:hypothetical protein
MSCINCDNFRGRSEDCICARNAGCFRCTSNSSPSLDVPCVRRKCRNFSFNITLSNFTSTTGLALRENTVKFNEKKNQLTVCDFIIPFCDIVNATIMVTGENKNGEKKSMVTKVVAVMHKNKNTVLEVSNKGLIARGKTAQKLVRNPDVPDDKWDYWSIAILNNMAFDNNDIEFSTTNFVFENARIHTKNNKTFFLTLTLDDENNRTVTEKDNIIRTMTQKNMLKQIKDGDENRVLNVVTMSFNGKDGVAVIKKVEFLKNNKYKIKLIADRKNVNRLSNNTTINKLTYTSVEKVTQNAELESVKLLNELCAINSEFFCGGFCTWCGITGGACRYTCAPV